MKALPVKKILKRTMSLISLVLVSTVMFMLFTYDTKHWNGLNEENDSTFPQKLHNRFYLCSMIYSTVGFGDITPKSRTAVIITNFQLLIVLLELVTIFTIYDKVVSLE